MEGQHPPVLRAALEHIELTAVSQFQLCGLRLAQASSLSLSRVQLFRFLHMPMEKAQSRENRISARSLAGEERPELHCAIHAIFRQHQLLLGRSRLQSRVQSGKVVDAGQVLLGLILDERIRPAFPQTIVGPGDQL